MTSLSVKVTMACRSSAKYPVLPNFACVYPSVQAQNALRFATQVQTEDFGVVEAWHLTKPTREVSTAGHYIID